MVLGGEGNASRIQYTQDDVILEGKNIIQEAMISAGKDQSDKPNSVQKVKTH